MGGHGGLNILPQKKWNVYNYDNRAIVEKDKKEAEALLPKVTELVDKLAKKNIIHKNKASNLKSKLTKFVTSMK